MSLPKRHFDAALLLRVWFEDNDPQRLRVRVVPLTPGLGGGVWTTVEDTTDAISRWLVDLTPQQEGSERGGTDHPA